MMKRTLIASLAAFSLTAGLSQADLTWTGAVDNNAFDEANWSLDGGGAPPAGTVDPFVPIMQNVTVTGGTVNESASEGGFEQFSIGDGYSLTLDNSVWTRADNEGWGGSNDVADVFSDFNLINGTDAQIQFASVGSRVNVDATSILRITGGGDGINSQTEPTQVNLALGGRLQLPNLDEFGTGNGQQGNEIFVNGVSYGSDPSILTFNGNIATAIPEASTTTLLALSGLVLMLLRRGK